MKTCYTNPEELARDLADTILAAITGEKNIPDSETETSASRCAQCKKCAPKSANRPHKDNVEARVPHYPIKDVKFIKNKTTVVFWKDGTKTVAICRDDDKFNPWTGLSIAICKKLMGATAFHDIFETYIPKDNLPEDVVKRMYAEEETK